MFLYKKKFLLFCVWCVCLCVCVCVCVCVSVCVSVCVFDFVVLSFVCAALTQWGDLPEVTDVRGLWCVCMLMMFLTLYSPSAVSYTHLTLPTNAEV